ncbi:hypothetical protein MMC31_003661 [Peltigera leucophlebia]|nr:hypothetical protein [Peltigera leucophlebia]
MASAQMVEADPIGDVILLLGNGSVGVRASSRVLSLASPVFAAMLGNRWLGDKSLSTTEPATIPLPDDHIGAITRLCRVLHYQCDMDEPIDFNSFENLALLCHKYDFGRAILPWTNVWIERFRSSRHCGPGSHHSLRFLYISYAFGNHEAFYKCYADYLVKADRDDIVDKRLNHGGPIDKDGCCPWCRGPRLSAELEKLTRDLGTALLPDGLLAAIEDHRKEELSLLHESIERILAEQMDEYPYGLDVCGPQCRHYGSEIGFVFGDLVSRRLWPKDQCLREHTLYSATRELLDFEDFFPQHCECRPSSLMVNFNYAAVSPKESRGLCLACVKRGKYSKKLGNCRASSAIECQRLRSLKRERETTSSPT